MAKKTMVALVRMQIKPGSATPGPPIAPAIGPHGVNIMEFCKSFNAKTESMKGKDYVMPIKMKIFSDRSFTFTVGQPTMSSLIKMVLGIKSGSQTPGSGKSAAVMTKDQAIEIAKTKMPDLTVRNMSAALRTVAGSARSMGIEVDFEINEVME